MPPGLGHYRGPNNLSNPFNNYPTSHTSHTSHTQAPAHYQNQAPFHTNSFNSATANSAAYQNGGHSNPFGGVLPNGGGSVAGSFGSGAGLGGPVASQEAQMGFARGAAMQQQQQAAQEMGLGRAPTMGSRIREVWKHNLSQEMAMIRSLVDKYPYVSMVCTEDPLTPHSQCKLTPVPRILSSLESLHDPWAPFPQRLTTTTNV
jgi:CCR4-NOT transcription complex subunit 7/8